MGTAPWSRRTSTTPGTPRFCLKTRGLIHNLRETSLYWLENLEDKAKVKKNHSFSTFLTRLELGVRYLLAISACGTTIYEP